LGWILSRKDARDVGTDDPTPGPQDGPGDEHAPAAVSAREVRPALRRWAVARLVEADPSRWGALVARARELDSRGAAGAIRGLLDAADALTPKDREAVIAMASAWRAKDVREAAAQIDATAAPSAVGALGVATPAERDRAGPTQSRPLQRSLF
jgi:hypothetical protein